MTRNQRIDGVSRFGTRQSRVHRTESKIGCGNVRCALVCLGRSVAGCIVLSQLGCRAVGDGLPPQEWWVLLCLTLISGSAVLKIPSVPVNFSISDVFTLTAAVVFGPAAGTVMVALDSLAISAFLTRNGLPFERILFNAAAPPPRCGYRPMSVFFASGAATAHRCNHWGSTWSVLGCSCFAGLYFFLNTSAIAVAIALHNGSAPSASGARIFRICGSRLSAAASVRDSWCSRCSSAPTADHPRDTAAAGR